jgi:Tail-tube assembly protein
MAIITIPTSVAGVSIPGPGNVTDKLIKGPLAALFSNAYELNSYHYPRDIMSSTKHHAIKFTINEIFPSQVNFDKVSGLTKDEGTIPSIGEGIFTHPVDTAVNFGTSLFKHPVDTVTNLYKTGEKLVKNTIESTYTPKEKKQAATIFLYMPDNVNIQYNASYNDTSKLEVGLQTLGGVGSFLNRLGLHGPANIFNATADNISSLSSNKAAQYALQSQGIAINPNMQVLFDGIDFRQYQLAFTFTPYSRQEANDINKIISIFKQHAMPRAANGGLGMFYVPPSTFNLDFLFNGQVNEKIHKVTESVITSIDVNYSPNGWSAHSDGSPVQIQLTLQFKEIDIVDRTKVKAGY